MSNRPTVSSLIPVLGVTALLLASHGAEAASREARANLAALDANGDGSISLDEFRARDHALVAMDLNSNDIIEPDELETFQQQNQSGRSTNLSLDKLDLDQDGVVTKDEAVEGVFQSLDRNDDGVLNKADRQRDQGDRKRGNKRRRSRR